MKAPSLRALSPVLLAVLCFGFCSCGGSSGPKPATGGCDKGVGLCITNCNLGCSSSRCSVTNIAVNQTLVLEFNQEIDPGTVNNATFRLRTASGAEPVGSYFVQSNVVMFIPEVRTIGGQTFFGFVRDESYVMTFPSPDTSVEVIRAKSGDALPVPFSCTLTVSEGIKDFDNKAPTAELLIPANRVGVSPETQIVVEFSEIVLTSSLSGPGQGLKFSIGNTTASGGCGGGAQELPGTLEFKVNQLLQRTQALFEPAGRLPGDKCIFVDVTDEIRDLSGKRAEPVTFNFITEKGIPKVFQVAEDFSDPAANMDPVRNGVKWAKGAATPVKAGGSGRLGDFQIEAGGIDTKTKDGQGRQIFEWNTDQTRIPKDKTLSGAPIDVSNGVFEFTSFVVNDTHHLRFVGSKIPVIHVTGKIDVRGTISVAGTSAVPPPKVGASGQTPAIGQKGFPGGPGAGAGGKGGDQHDRSAAIHGVDGIKTALPSGHPLSSAAAATAGKGSLSHPKTRNGPVVARLMISPGFFMVQMMPSGGGGGGYVSPGGDGELTKNTSPYLSGPIPPGDKGEIAKGGAALAGFDSLLTRSEKSSLLFLIGGAGGGGAGSGPAGNFKSSLPSVDWNSGGGGAGGGGAIQLKAGGSIIVGRTGRILATGGDGASNGGQIAPYYPAPGGAGSGGSVLLQSAGALDLRGKVDVTGGKKGRLDGNGGIGKDGTGLLAIDSWSGAGGDGYIRAETDTASPPDFKLFLDVFSPQATAKNVGILRKVDADDRSMLATNWYDTRQIFPPKFVSYEILADIDGAPRKFSDSPGGTKAETGQPLILYVQGALLDAQTGKPKTGTVTPWTEGTVNGLNVNPGNIYRFMILLDLSKTSQRSIKVKNVTFTYQS